MKDSIYTKTHAKKQEKNQGRNRISGLWEEKQGRKWTEEDVQEVYELSESKILEIVHNYAEPKPYVVETVNKLREMGLKIGSTTGYTDEMMALVVPKAAELGYAPRM